MFFGIYNHQRPRLALAAEALANRVRPSVKECQKILQDFNVTQIPLQPCGLQLQNLDSTKRLDPILAGALEVLMATHGFILMRNQGQVQHESNIDGQYLTGAQQCQLSKAFGLNELYSTHGVHPETPNRDVFRLSNDPSHGFNQVGPEWHNDGSFCRDVFGHVIYHIIRAPEGPGNTNFAHLGMAFDRLSTADQKKYRQCASVNSMTGVIHPLVHDHYISGKTSLYLHTGMTGALIERVTDPSSIQEKVSASSSSSSCHKESLEGIKAWNEEEMDELFCKLTNLLDSEDICYSHKWQQGDVIIIDNMAIAHKATPGAHKKSSGLRILHRTTVKGYLNLDPDPKLQFPLKLDTGDRCPFKNPGAVWEEGYVGFRWGDWNERCIPH